MAKSITVTLPDHLYEYLGRFADVHASVIRVEHPNTMPPDRDTLIGVVIKEVVEGWAQQAANRIAARIAQASNDDDKGTPPIVNSA